VPKTWIITGSSRGLGRALAEAALAAGEKVAATARRVDDLQGLKDRYRDQVLLLPLDVTNETQAIESLPLCALRRLSAHSGQNNP
jgi:NADP-dependent 3-hydroxy acid dehydrogenase YdfG